MSRAQEILGMFEAVEINELNIRTVGFSHLSNSFASEIKGLLKNKGFDAAWDAIPSTDQFKKFEEVPLNPTEIKGDKGIWIGKETVTKFLIKGEDK